MGLFDKKYCDFCGEKIGVFGNNKLKDANMCDECKKAVSRFAKIENYSKEKMDKHLAYRKKNKEKVMAFNSTIVLGPLHKVHIDETKGLFLITKAKNFKNHNPDVLELSKIKGINIDIDSNKREVMRTNKAGERVSCNPPRYEYMCKMKVVLDVESKWFSKMRINVLKEEVEMDSPEYKQAYDACEEIKEALTKLSRKSFEEAVEAAKPKTAVQCPYCGATTVPDAQGCCEYCGGALG